MDKELLLSVLAGQSRHLLTLAAGALVAKGAMQADQSGAFIQIGGGIVMWAISAVWSWYQKDGQQMVRDALKHITGRRTTEGAVEVAKSFDAGVAAKALTILALGISFLLAPSLSVFAADLPFKAPFASAPLPCLPTACTGFYVGANVSGVMTNANVIGNGINGSLAGGGQSLGLQGGYQLANGTWFFAGELSANYVTNGGVNEGNSAPARYRVMEVVKVGTALATLLGLAAPANVGTPPVPSQFVAQIISPYILAGAVQSGIGNGWATGAGIEFALTANWFLDTRYTYIDYGSKSLTPNVVAKSENLTTIGLDYKF